MTQFTLMEMLDAPPDVFRSMIQDISDYERKIVVQSFQNLAELLRSW